MTIIMGDTGRKEYEVVLTERPPEGFTLVVGFPGVGLTGFLAVENIVSKREMREIGYINAEIVPPVMIIVDNVPKHPVRLFLRDDLVILKSEVPIMTDSAITLGETIIKWAASSSAKRIVILDGLPTPGRTTVNDRTAVWGVSTLDEGMKTLELLDVKPIAKGIIMGVASTMLVEAMARKMECVGLFAESLQDVPDVRAAASVIGKFAKLASMPLEVTDLINFAAELENMYQEQLMQMADGQPYKPPESKPDGDKSNSPSMYG